MADLASLVIGLRADVATLQSDLGKANALNSRYAKSASDSWTSAAADIGKALGAAAVTFAGVAVALGKQAIDAADNFNKMSQKVGVSVEALSALSVQAKLSDVSIDQLQGGLAKFARNLSEAAAGSKQQAAAFQAIGISQKDAIYYTQHMDEAIGKLSSTFSGYRDSASKTALAQEFFGKSGAELIPLLNQLGTEGFAKAREEAEKFGQVISGDTAAAAEQFNDNLTKLKLETQGFANAVIAELLPSLNRLTDDMVEAGETTNRYGESASALVGIVKGVTFAFLALGEAIRAVVNVAAASGDTLIEIMSLPAKAGMALADGGLDAARKSIADSLGGIRNAWTSASTGVGDAIDGIKGDFNDLFGTFSNVSSGAKTTATAVGSMEAPLVKTAKSTKDAGAAAAKAATETIQYSEALRKAAGSLQAIQGMASRYADDIEDIEARMTGADDAQIEYNKALREIQENYQALLELGPPTAEAVAAVGTATELAGKKMDLTHVWESQQEGMKQYQDELRKTQDMWGDFADAVFDAVTQSGNFLKNLLNNLKSIVSQMLKEWFRTSVIGAFTGSGGGGVGWMQMAGAAFGLAGGGGGGMGYQDATTGNLNMSSAYGTAQGGISLFNAGKTFFGGFESAFSSSSMASSNMFGTYTPDYGAGTYAPSGLGYGVAAAGGIYAGYNRYQQSQGGAAGIAGAAAYGYGTYAATIGVSAAMSGGIAAGVAAIPVVGWIAIAAMLIDKFSGGKLFGTKGEVQSGVSTLSVDAAGANYSTFLALKGQDALFGGADWSTENIAQTPEEQKAAQEFYESMVQTMGQYAEQFGVKAGDLVSAKFGQQFDKHGNPTGITSSTIAGYEYSNLKPEEFQAAYLAANQLEVLSQFDDKLKDTVEQFRDSADQLVSIANGLSVAQGYFQAGGAFLATTDQTLSGVVELASRMQMAGEAIGDTINRLIQAQAQYDQFVGQFKPAVNFVDDFEAALSGIRTQLLANIKTANDLARAAGAAGASEKDLANITQTAANQMAAAVQALEQSAQALAFSMGLSNVGTIDQINAEIARLQEKAGAGATAVNSFGDAMSNAAQRATEAMDLLLGNLSPLNDQAKLQVALQGLRAGTVSESQVLEIGRRLYATSQAYTDLFNMVTHMGSGLQQAAGGGGGGIGTGTGGGLSGAERERLSELLKQQTELQAAADFQNANTLAQQIAEIAAAKGEDIDAVLESLHIDRQALEARLGLSDEAFDKLIADIQARQDDNKENTLSIVEVLNKILLQLGGTPDAAPTGGTPGTPAEFGGGRPTGHGGHRPQETAEIVDAIDRGFNRVAAQGGRSARR